MDDKLTLPIDPPISLSTKAASRKRHAKSMTFGAVMSAVAILSFRHLSFSGAGEPRGLPTNAWGSGDLRDWIAHEASFSERKIFDQLGPTVGAAEGLVVASPSTSHPDYFYTWTRYDTPPILYVSNNAYEIPIISSDSALVTASIMDRLVNGENELEPALRLYSYSQAKLQDTCNRSGCPADGGLGEPKFNVDGTPFGGDWGRPQRASSRSEPHDGPALRAITLIRFANYLLDRGTDADHSFVSRFLYNQDTSSGSSVIKNDLEYTSHSCFDSSFDLWEEKQDLHFFTLVACRKALDSGAALASRLGDLGAAAWYQQQFKVMNSRILDSGAFHFPDGSYRAYANPENLGRRGVDSAVLLAILAAGKAGDPNFGPTAPAVLASVKVYVDAFRGQYAIANSSDQVFGLAPVPTGRYPGESSPVLIDWALSEFMLAGNITVTDVSLRFFQQFVSVKPGDVLTRGSTQFNLAVIGMRAWSDGFYKLLHQFQGPGGVLYEQFNRNTGEPQGASNLTWSFAAFADAARARRSLEAFTG